VNIEEVFNVLPRERLPSHALTFEYLLSCTDLSSGIDRIHETSGRLSEQLQRRDAESGLIVAQWSQKGDPETKDRESLIMENSGKANFGNKRINEQ
jgi:hypothetical protein